MARDLGYQGPEGWMKVPAPQTNSMKGPSQVTRLITDNSCGDEGMIMGGVFYRSLYSKDHGEYGIHLLEG